MKIVPGDVPASDWDAACSEIDRQSREIDRLRARVADLEAAEFRLRARMAREADAPEGQRYLWVREIVDLLSGRLQ